MGALARRPRGAQCARVSAHTRARALLTHSTMRRQQCSNTLARRHAAHLLGAARRPRLAVPRRAVLSHQQLPWGPRLLRVQHLFDGLAGGRLLGRQPRVLRARAHVWVCRCAGVLGFGWLVSLVSLHSRDDDGSPRPAHTHTHTRTRTRHAHSTTPRTRTSHSARSLSTVSVLPRSSTTGSSPPEAPLSHTSPSSPERPSEPSNAMSASIQHSHSSRRPAAATCRRRVCVCVCVFGAGARACVCVCRTWLGFALTRAACGSLTSSRDANARATCGDAITGVTSGSHTARPHTSGSLYSRSSCFAASRRARVNSTPIW
jgi:hypothetical protein